MGIDYRERTGMALSREEGLRVLHEHLTRYGIMKAILLSAGYTDSMIYDMGFSREISTFVQENPTVYPPNQPLWPQQQQQQPTQPLANLDTWTANDDQSSIEIDLNASN